MLSNYYRVVSYGSVVSQPLPEAAARELAREYKGASLQRVDLAPRVVNIGTYDSYSPWRPTRYGYEERTHNRRTLREVYDPYTGQLADVQALVESRIQLRAEDSDQIMDQPWFGGSQTSDPRTVETLAKLIAYSRP